MKFPLPKVGLKQIRKFLAIFLAVGLVFAAGYFAGTSNIALKLQGKPKVTITRTLPAGHEDLDFSLFWAVWDRLSQSYFDKTKLDPAKMVYGAISGMVAAVGDPYTVFLPPEENKLTQEDLEGNFDGVGIQIGFKGTQLAVIAPLPGTPAETAGVKAGDFIIEIRDEKREIDMGTVGITLPEAVKAIRGPAGTSVMLILLREGVDEPIEVEIRRASIDVPSVIVTYVGDNQDIAQIKLLKFGGSTNGEWDKVVRDIVKNPKVKGIIVDVRNNPGGFLQSSVDIAGEFVETGKTVVIQEMTSGSREEFTATGLARLKSYPTVVLVNQGSASASEILAGALRDIRGLKLVGETTFGKGTIQEPQDLDGGAGIHITVAKWLTPKGTWVNDNGLEPDVKIEDNPDTAEDEQLQEAIGL